MWLHTLIYKYNHVKRVPTDSIPNLLFLYIHNNQMKYQTNFLYRVYNKSDVEFPDFKYEFFIILPQHLYWTALHW